MKIDQLKKVLSEFGDNVKYDYDLKKKIGSILVVKPRFFTKQIILKN